MTFALGARSLTNLQGVISGLVAVTQTAIARSPVDFGVPAKAVRTLAEQRVLLAHGVTKTLHSKHLVHDDGHGWAEDLVPYVDGAFVWEYPVGHPRHGQVREEFFQIAAAMQSAAATHGAVITWGAVWDRTMDELGSDLHAAVAQYNARHPGPDFNDYPHFQWGRN